MVGGQRQEANENQGEYGPAGSEDQKKIKRPSTTNCRVAALSVAKIHARRKMELEKAGKTFFQLVAEEKSRDPSSL